MSAATDLRLRQKLPPVGIAAGAEDAKYQAKYKELKRKVKDIEADNDKLHFQVLQAKLTIRRMKMERAILYERLTTVPPSPNLQDRHPLPPMAVMQPGGPAGPPHTHHRLPPGGGRPQHRDYPFHSSANIDVEQQRIGGGPAAHLHPDNIRHHHQHLSHARSGGGERINLTPGTDPRNVAVDNQPTPSSPRLPVHSPPSRILSTQEGAFARQPQHAPYESRSVSNIPHDSHHGHTSPPVSSHHVGRSHSRKRSHSHSSPRTPYPHQMEVHQSGHIHAAQPYRVLSSGSNNNVNNPGHGPGSGTGGALAQQPLPLHQYPENLTSVQPSRHSPPLSEMEFERSGRAHHSHHHLHQPLPHQHPHSHAHSGGAGHQYPHSQHPHHHHVHHHHQHNHSQAQAQNEYGGVLPVGDPPTSSVSPAIQAHGAGYESAGNRGTANAGPSESASASGGAPPGAASGSGRTHAHRVAYEYPPTTQSEIKRERDGARERERDRDPDREWERERDRAREYSRGELINYSPPHHRTRSSQSRPLSRTQSQSHLASVQRSQSQTAVGHTGPTTSGEYDHSTSNSSRSRTAPSSGVPAPGTQAQYHSEDPSQAQGYRDYPPPDPNAMYTPRVAPSSRAVTPGVPSNGSGSNSGHTSIAGPEASNTSGPHDRDRDREAARKDRGRQQQAIGSSPMPSPGGGAGENDSTDQTRALAAVDSRKRSRNEMEMEVDAEYQAKNEVEEGRKGKRNGGASGSGREMSLQPQDDSRGVKRYHRQADSSPERR